MLLPPPRLLSPTLSSSHALFGLNDTAPAYVSSPLSLEITLCLCASGDELEAVDEGHNVVRVSNENQANFSFSTNKVFTSLNILYLALKVCVYLLLLCLGLQKLRSCLSLETPRTGECQLPPDLAYDPGCRLDPFYF